MKSKGREMNNNLGIISKLSSINFRIFHSFDWSKATPELPDLKKYNIFYGKNSTGKTSISALFAGISQRDSSANNLSIVLNGHTNEMSAADAHNKGMLLPIHTFNSNIVSRMVQSIDGKEGIGFAHIIGEKNISIREKIMFHEDEITTAAKEAVDSLAALEKLNEERDDFLRVVKDKIKSEANKKYPGKEVRKIDDLVDNLDIEVRHLSYEHHIDEEDWKSCVIQLGDDDVNQLRPMPMLKLSSILSYRKLSSTVRNVIRGSLNKNVDNSTVNSDEISDAVKTCESYKHSLESIGDISQRAPEFHEMLREEFKHDLINLEKAKHEALKWLSIADHTLKNKDNPRLSSEQNNIVIQPDEVAANIHLSIYVINNIIKRNNKITRKSNGYRTDTLIRIMENIVSDTIPKEFYGKEIHTNSAIENAHRRILNFRGKITALQDDFTIVESDANNLNRVISKHLGHDELTFKVNTVLNGYVLHREKNSAINLSDGERNTVALLYFLAQIEKIKDGQCIVVIDDPSSSMDSSSMLDSVTSIALSVEHVAQVFLLTHDLDFLGEIKRALGCKESNTSYYSIHAPIKNGIRSGQIEKMPETLRDRKSDYLNLFEQVLMASKKPETLSQSDIFSISNNARRLMEMFVRRTCLYQTGSVHSIIKNIESMDKHEINRITRILDRRSHGQSEESANMTPSATDIQSNMQDVLNVLKKINEGYYALTSEAIEKINHKNNG